MAAMMRTSTLIGLRAPEAFDHALLKYAEQLDLDGHRQSPISSRKSVDWWAASNRPICRESASVYAPFSRPNSSLSISGRRNRRAAHADHPALTPRAEVVNRPRHHFLARSRFTEQQDGRGRGRHLSDLRQHSLDGRALHPFRQFSLSHGVLAFNSLPVVSRITTPPSAPATLSAEFNPSS